MNDIVGVIGMLSLFAVMWYGIVIISSPHSFQKR